MELASITGANEVKCKTQSGRARSQNQLDSADIGSIKETTKGISGVVVCMNNTLKSLNLMLQLMAWSKVQKEYTKLNTMPTSLKEEDMNESIEDRSLSFYNIFCHNTHMHTSEIRQK